MKRKSRTQRALYSMRMHYGYGETTDTAMSLFNKKPDELDVNEVDELVSYMHKQGGFQ